MGGLTDSLANISEEELKKLFSPFGHWDVPVYGGECGQVEGLPHLTCSEWQEVCRNQNKGFASRQKGMLGTISTLGLSAEVRLSSLICTGILTRTSARPVL